MHYAFMGNMVTSDMIDGSTVKTARDQLGESQAQFGRRFGVDQSTIHRWETEGPPVRGSARTLIERVIADITAAPAAVTEERAAS